jgi:hypothetical protein
MIDREARRQVAELLRHLVSGQITNDEFEDRLPQGSADRGVSEISSEAWYLYSDLWEHRLVGEQRLSPEARTSVARTVLFLQSDREYEWPEWPFGSRFLSALLRLFTLGVFGRGAKARYEKAGDIGVWPFLRREDYEAALQAPPYLSGRSNNKMQQTSHG